MDGSGENDELGFDRGSGHGARILAVSRSGLDQLACITQRLLGNLGLTAVHRQPQHDELQPDAMVDQFPRQQRQQLADVKKLALGDEVERVVFDEYRGACLVARGQRVPDRLCQHLALPEPFGGRQMQRRDHLRFVPFHFTAEEIAEQMMITEPAPLFVKRDKEQVSRLDLGDRCLGVGRPHHRRQAAALKRSKIEL